MTVDAHQHFWTLARGDYGWLTPDKGPIYRDFGPDDLAPLMAQAGVTRTVLVQAAPTIAETEFLLRVADETTFVAGVLGWVDFEADDAPERIAALAAHPKLKGLRPMVQNITDDDWMLRAELAPAIEAMISAGLSFDALVAPRHLPVLRRFAAQYPDLRIVIDHAAKPDVARRELQDWSREIRVIAAETPLFCKFSGLVTEAAPGCRVSDIRPVSDVLIDAFGPARLIWGSDWPVLHLNGDYLSWRAMAGALTADLSAEDRESIFGGVAERFYGLIP